MSNLIICKILLIVSFLIKSNYSFNVKLFKDFNVFFGMVPVPLPGISFFYRSHESHEFAGNDPIDISILYSLVVLVLLHVKGPEIVPLEFNCVFQALEALQERTIVETVSFAGVSIRFE